MLYFFEQLIHGHDGDDDGPTLVVVRATPLGETLFLLSFEDIPPPEAGQTSYPQSTPLDSPTTSLRTRPRKRPQRRRRVPQMASAHSAQRAPERLGQM